MRRSGVRGFTLIEIMIVIAIIGVLLMVLLPNMVKSKYQAQWNACGQYERTLAAAAESYNAQFGTYPSSLSVLTTSSPIFINIIPCCPSNGVSYAAVNAYQRSSAGDNFTIACPGSHYLVLSPDVKQGFPQYNPQRGLLQYDANR